MSPQQPLNRVRSNVRVIAGPGPQTFENRPALAPYVAKIIAQWSYIEANLCSILAYLLSAEARQVMAMVQALRSSNAQLDMIEAAAVAKLIDPELEALQAVIILARKMKSKRDKIAHHIWAYCDELLDSLILIDPSAYLEIFVRLQESQTTCDENALLLSDNPDTNYCFVYRNNDFIEIIDEMETVSKCTTFLINYLHKLHPSRDQIYSLLSKQPDFQTALLNVRKRRPQPESPQSPPS